MPSIWQLSSQSFWAISSSKASLEHCAGAQSLETKQILRLMNDIVLMSINMTIESLLYCMFNTFYNLKKIMCAYRESKLDWEFYWNNCSVPVISSTLVVQLGLHSAVDGGLGSLNSGLGEGAEDLDCYLHRLAEVPKQLWPHHTRMEGVHSHTTAYKHNHHHISLSELTDDTQANKWLK